MKNKKPRKRLLVTVLVVVGFIAIVTSVLPKPPADLSSVYLTETVATHDLRVTVDANGQLTNVSSGSKKAVMNVSEYDIARLKDGQKVAVSIGALDASVNGKVDSISDKANNTTGVQAYVVTVSLNTLPSTARIGMSVSTSVTTGTASGVIAIPSSAVTESSGKQTVKILQGSQVVEKTVKTGIVAGSLVEITSGLSAGEKLVTGRNGSIPSIGGSGGFMPPAPGGVSP